MARRSKLVGASKLRRTLRRLPEEARGGIRSALAAGAARILQSAQQLVPVATGLLRSLLRVRVSRDGLGAQIGLIGKRANRKAFYGRFVEFGTREQPAQPFLTPAFEAERQRLLQDARKEIGKALERASDGD